MSFWGDLIKRSEFIRTLEKAIDVIDDRLSGHDKNISDLENHNQLLKQKIETIEKENDLLRSHIDRVDERLHSLKIQAETPGVLLSLIHI